MTDFERPRWSEGPTGVEDTILEVEDNERYGASFLPTSRPSALWRWGFPLVVLAIIVWSAVLLLGGLQTILDSEEGRTREAITDPAAPGFEAFVEQTWSMLVVTEDEAGGLAQVAVVAVADRESGGGTVMLIPPELVTAVFPPILTWANQDRQMMPWRCNRSWSAPFSEKAMKATTSSAATRTSPAGKRITVVPSSPVSIRSCSTSTGMGATGPTRVAQRGGVSKVASVNSTSKRLATTVRRASTPPSR